MTKVIFQIRIQGALSLDLDFDTLKRRSASLLLSGSKECNRLLCSPTYHCSVLRVSSRGKARYSCAISCFLQLQEQIICMIAQGLKLLQKAIKVFRLEFWNCINEDGKEIRNF